MAGPGYLPKVGPPELRFAQRSPRLDPSAVLPPLTVIEAVETTTNAVAEISSESLPPTPSLPEATDEVAMEDIWMGPPAPEAQTTEAPPAKPEQEIAPQMLLQFFSKDGTRQGIVQTPVEFTPPPPSRSSTATYISR